MTKNTSYNFNQTAKIPETKQVKQSFEQSENQKKDPTYSSNKSGKSQKDSYVKHYIQDKSEKESKASKQRKAKSSKSKLTSFLLFLTLTLILLAFLNFLWPKKNINFLAPYDSPAVFETLCVGTEGKKGEGEKFFSCLNSKTVLFCDKTEFELVTCPKSTKCLCGNYFVFKGDDKDACLKEDNTCKNDILELADLLQPKD